MRKFYIGGFVLLALLTVQVSVNSQPFTLFKDIRPGSAGTSDFYSINVNGTLFFTIDDEVHGKELWKSNNTAAGTELVRDINPGAASSITGILYNANGTVYFFADDGVHGNELWKSDGTAAGTVLVKDINTGDAITPTEDKALYINGIFYFAADDGVHGIELWKTDGTEAGTVMIKDIWTGADGSYPNYFVELNGLLYFAGQANNGGANTLWKSDGTEAGTQMVFSRPFTGLPRDLTVINGIIYFSNQNGSLYGRELWMSDGTDAGSKFVKDINDYLASSSDPTSFIGFNNEVYFVANDRYNGRELYKTNGTEAGTVMVKNIDTHHLPGDLDPNTPYNVGSNPRNFTVLNGSLYFVASTVDDGSEIWKTDGTEAGTVMLKDIVPGLQGSSDPVILGKSGFNFYFSANDGVHGNELWVSDGTADGTVMLQDIEPGPGSSDPTSFIEVNGKMYVSVTTTATGRELWVANAPANGPLPLQLLEFKGSLADNDGLLQWKTDNELNTKSFVLERSTDGRNFITVGSINAANTSGVHNYNYTDYNIKSLGASLVYYRLRQVDGDNKATYSRIVALTMDKQKSFALLYPNPVSKTINLTITLAKKDRLTWQLTDIYGRQIRNGYYDLGAGSTALVIDGSNLSTGNYYLRLNGELLQQTIKLVKQ